jgi:hypothetical protein
MDENNCDERTKQKKIYTQSTHGANAINNQNFSSDIILSKGLKAHSTHSQLYRIKTTAIQVPCIQLTFFNRIAFHQSIEWQRTTTTCVQITCFPTPKHSGPPFHLPSTGCRPVGCQHPNQTGICFSLAGTSTGRMVVAVVSFEPHTHTHSPSHAWVMCRVGATWSRHTHTCRTIFILKSNGGVSARKTGFSRLAQNVAKYFILFLMFASRIEMLHDDHDATLMIVGVLWPICV